MEIEGALQTKELLFAYYIGDVWFVWMIKRSPPPRTQEFAHHGGSFVWYYLVGWYGRAREIVKIIRGSKKCAAHLRDAEPR